MDESISKIAALVPAYNSANTLDELLSRLLMYVPVTNVFVVDDGSTDRTSAIAEQRGVNVIRLGTNRGKGAALSEGFRVLKDDSRFQSVVTLDADLQHRPEEILDFVREKLQTGADIVIGRRNRRGSRMPIHRRLSNFITSYLVSVRTGTEILDSQCGYRLIGMNVLSKVSIQSAGYEMETEFLIKAVKKGFTVRYVPIETVYDGEKSHMTNWRTTLNFIKVLFRDY